jgi:lysophospholipase L1-like esterase
MKNTIRGFVFVLFAVLSFQTFAQTRIVVLGSSTAAGSGAWPLDSSWVARLQFHFRQNTSAGNPDTVVTNLALGGTTTYHIMQDGFTPPPNRPAPDLNRNVTEALGYNPEVIIINMPSNDIASGYDPVEFMNNLRSLFQQIQSAGVRAFITTTQPRNDLSDVQRQTLRNLVDSINNNFGVYAIDFWNVLVTNDGQNRIKPEFNADNIHPNNQGHRLLFERVIAENLFAMNSPLPVVLSNFKGKRIGNEIELSWTTSSEEANTFFIVQKSSDGISFSNAGTVQGRATNGTGVYRWIDRSPSTKNLYRLEIHEQGKIFYSSIVQITSISKGIAIKRLFREGSFIVSEIETDLSEEVLLTINSSSGQTVLQKKQIVTSPSGIIRLPVHSLAAGQYYLTLTTSKGVKLTQGFIR